MFYDFWVWFGDGKPIVFDTVFFISISSVIIFVVATVLITIFRKKSMVDDGFSIAVIVGSMFTSLIFAMGMMFSGIDYLREFYDYKTQTEVIDGWELRHIFEAKRESLDDEFSEYKYLSTEIKVRPVEVEHIQATGGACFFSMFIAILMFFIDGDPFLQMDAFPAFLLGILFTIWFATGFATIVLIIQYIKDRKVRNET